MPEQEYNPIVPVTQDQLTSRTQFTVIEDRNANNFSLRIGNLMREGWLLHGPMTVIPGYWYAGNNLAPTTYIQSLFRR
jgi:hypothetical protein